MSNWEKRTAADGLATCADELAAAHAEAVKSDKAFSAVSAELAKARAEVELMQWLVRLVTPPNGLVLDPFAGSGTTGVACIREGLRFLGFELEEAHCEIARGRIREATLQPRRPLGSPELKRGKVDDRQLGLFGRTA